MKILALESSTSSAKALLYDTKTKKTTVKQRIYPKMSESVSLHDAETVLHEMLAAGKEVLAGQSDIEMIALSGTWHSLCLCDEKMGAVTPAYPWTYTGASGICRELREDKDYASDYYRRTGCMVNAIYPFFKLLLLQKQGYRLGDHRIASQSIYNTYYLTDKCVVTQCMASGSGLLNTHTLSYDEEVLRQLDVPEESMPELVPYHQTFPLSKRAAAELGLKTGIPVIPANSDGGLNQIGAGALRVGVMTFSVGTSGAIRLTTEKPILPQMQGTWCYRSPKSWLSGAATSGACNCIDWFKRKVGGGVSYQELETKELITDAPIFLPFVFGERCPGWNDTRRASFEGLKESDTVKSLYQAVQEGVLFNLYQCYEALTDVNGHPEEIRLSGGILNSEKWMQMCADIFGREILIDHEAQASLMGGAALAMELLGELRQAEDFEVKTGGRLVPDLTKKQFYQERYGIYKDAYRRQIS